MFPLKAFFSLSTTAICLELSIFSFFRADILNLFLSTASGVAPSPSYNCSIYSARESLSFLTRLTTYSSKLRLST